MKSQESVDLSICRLLTKHGLTTQKVQHVALQRTMELKSSFMASVYTFPAEMFVWIDESGSDSKDQLRRYDYALREERAVCRKLLVHTVHVNKKLPFSFRATRYQRNGNDCYTALTLHARA